MSIHCATITPKLANLQEHLVTLKQSYETAVQSGDFTQFKQEQQTYLEFQEQLRTELKESIKVLVETFVAKRDNRSDAVSVRVNADLTAVVTGTLRYSSRESFTFSRLISELSGDLYLFDVITAEGLTLPQTIGGYLNLSGLTDAAGLTLPQTIGGYLNLYNLTTAEGLTLPQTIGGYLNLQNLTTVEGLDYSQIREIKGDVHITSRGSGVRQLFEDLKTRGILQGEIRVN